MAKDTTSGEAELEVQRWRNFSRRDLRLISKFPAVAGTGCVELVAMALEAAACVRTMTMTYH
jgi:hypothetical protein